MNRFLVVLLRVLVTVALLWWIAREPSIRAQLAAMPTPPAPGWLLPSWLASGVNELALVPLCAVAPATAVLVSLTGFFVGATWSLPGAGVFLWFRALNRANPQLV